MIDWLKVMAAYRQVYDSRHLQADYQKPGSAPEPYFRQSSIGYLYFFYFWLFTLSQKKTICNPLYHPTWKCTTLTCEVPNFFYLTEGLHCTCVFHPCEMRCFVLAFSILAFSSTCVFSAPVDSIYCKLYGVDTLARQCLCSRLRRTDALQLQSWMGARACCYHGT